MSGTQDPNWLIATLFGVIGSLATGMTAMFKLMRADRDKQLAALQAVHDKQFDMMRKEIDDLKQEARDCREDRELLWERIANLNAKVETSGVSPA